MMDIQLRKQMNNILDKIKYFLMLLGIFALMSVFYITKKKLEIKSLHKLIQKAYQQKQKILEDKISLTLQKSKEAKGKTKGFVKKLNKLDTEKEEIESKLGNLTNQELTDSIDSWFQSRNKS